ncbi:Phosphoribosyl pyrophosphate synthase-associated protein 2 [Dissostichus eleginoides]|uniref:Phosphoribosyl pyrophosphate synthase-associated protein 2 n=1 Tax=Dissostichus eleginoides TaxID=100907 RepID=A0AAD9B7Y9_DISEL|nr:Phosphoribosyl pyrophosphate synthase-associated protein 2 [Dissostichus eleginoides]
MLSCSPRLVHGGFGERGSLQIPVRNSFSVPRKATVSKTTEAGDGYRRRGRHVTRTSRHCAWLIVRAEIGCARCAFPPAAIPPRAARALDSGTEFFSFSAYKEEGGRLGVELGKVQVYQEANRETRVQIQESVRGKDVFVIQTMSKTSCARSITGVVPYFPYSKQCKMRKRGSIVTKLVASMMCKAGLTHLITMDLHQKEIQGFFNIPVDNLRASPFLLQYIQEEIPDYRNAVIVAKSPASAKRAQSFAERLRLGLAVIHGEAQDAESDQVDGRHSPPAVKTTGAIHPSMDIPLLIPKEKPPITVVGDVGGRIAIIVDDIIDDVDSFVAAAETLKERGAYKIFVMATHGILSSDAPRLIEESAIDEGR